MRLTETAQSEVNQIGNIKKAWYKTLVQMGDRCGDVCNGLCLSWFLQQ